MSQIKLSSGKTLSEGQKEVRDTQKRFVHCLPSFANVHVHKDNSNGDSFIYATVAVNPTQCETSLLIHCYKITYFRVYFFCVCYKFCRNQVYLYQLTFFFLARHFLQFKKVFYSTQYWNIISAYCIFCDAKVITKKQELFIMMLSYQ